MANPQVDNLIAELSAILEQNRQKRNAADAMMEGIAQGKQRAAQEQTFNAEDAAGAMGQRPTNEQLSATAPMRRDDAPDGLGRISPRYREQTKINQHFRDKAQGDQDFERAFEQAMFDRDFAKSQRQPLVPIPDTGPPAQYPQYQAGQVESPGGMAQAQTMEGRPGQQSQPMQMPGKGQNGFSAQEMQLLDALAARGGYQAP